jgi:CheY-like chemotaxis protein
MNRKQFTAALRTALMQLDDLQSLGRSPLLSFLPEGATGGPVALQQILIAAIESLQESQAASAEQMHDILYYRYVEQMIQKNLSYQLGISVRHLRRLQENAISLLADRLMNHLGVSQPNEIKLESEGLQLNPGVDEEIAWLRESFGTESSNIFKEIQKALEEGYILAKHYQVRIAHPSLQRAQQVTVPSQILRQSLLAALSYAVTQLATLTNSSDRLLQVEAACTHPVATVTFQQISTHPSMQRMEFDHSPLNTASQLLAPFGGHVKLENMNPLRITVSVPTVGSIPVLLLDDNPDARQLLQRYADDSPFRVIATADSQQIIELTQQWDIRVILLDIMMPEVDGWDLLARLRHHPASQHIPLVVCTILPQKELAHLLGASVFLQKPISQQQFLDTLTKLTFAASRAPD